MSEQITNPDNKRELGNAAESLAVKFLKNKGYEIVKRNFHFGRYGEIDIIAKHGDILVFVEVRSKSTDTYGDPLESITVKKQRAIRRVAEGYLYVNKITDMPCRIDVITIDYTKPEPVINHLENAL